jgi:large subunit ribosomal protein L19
MSKHALIDQIETEQLKKEIPEFGVGDTVRVSVKIVEGTKERIQTITGTVIARKGHGLSETFSIYRIAYGSAMERVIPIHSPRVTEIEKMRSGKVRRSKLYYLRGAFGKKAKVKERIGGRRKKVAVVVEKATETRGESLPESTENNTEA